MNLSTAASLVSTHRDCGPTGDSLDPMGDIVALLKRHNLKYDPHPRHLRKQQASRWRLPPGMASQLQKDLQLEYEWFAFRWTAVSTSHNTPVHTWRMRALGRLWVHIPINGLDRALFHPPHGSEEARRALRWAIMSACEQQPASNFGILVHKTEIIYGACKITHTSMSCAHMGWLDEDNNSLLHHQILT